MAKTTKTKTLEDALISLSSKKLENTSGDPQKGDTEEEKKELRKKLKAHHKMLSETADDHYEKDNKELGRKYREMANKLAADMEDEGAELSLSDYEIDDANLKNSQLSQMIEIKDFLTAQLADYHAKTLETLTYQLSGLKVNIPSEEDQMAKLKELVGEAQKILGGNK